jgi:hypothetical protein
MRTKTLLLTAALSAVGIVSSMGQAVYSVNAVGYVNLTVNKNNASTETVVMIANPLDAGNNTVAEVLPVVPDATTLITFDNTTGQFDNSNTYFGGWDRGNAPFAPGAAAFLFFDNGAIGASVTVTFVGQVPEGMPLRTSVAGAGRVSYLASKAPLAGHIETDLGFPPQDFDTVFLWDRANFTYQNSISYFAGWDRPPLVGVAEGFVLVTDSAATARNWDKNFDVTP